MPNTKAAIAVGGVVAKPGGRAQGYFPVSTDPPVNVPVVIVNGTHPGPTLVVMAGVHGTEYPGIEAARRFALELDPEHLSGQVVIVPIANPNSFYRRLPSLSGFGNQNLNWTFPGRHGGSSTEHLAYSLFHDVIRKADLFVDLHGGNMIETLTPYVAYVETPNDRKQLELGKRLAVAYGIKYICKGDTQGSPYLSAAQVGIPSLLAEAGGQGILSEPHVQILLRGLNNVARAFGICPGEPTSQSQYVWVNQTVSLRAATGGLYYPCVGADDKIEKGQKLGQITDAFGARISEIVAPVEGFVKWVVTALAVNQGDPILNIATPE